MASGVVSVQFCSRTHVRKWSCDPTQQFLNPHNYLDQQFVFGLCIYPGQWEKEVKDSGEDSFFPVHTISFFCQWFFFSVLSSNRNLFSYLLSLNLTVTHLPSGTSANMAQPIFETYLCVALFLLGSGDSIQEMSKCNYCTRRNHIGRKVKHLSCSDWAQIAEWDHLNSVSSCQGDPD